MRLIYYITLYITQIVFLFVRVSFTLRDLGIRLFPFPFTCFMFGKNNLNLKIIFVIKFHRQRSNALQTKTIMHIRLTNQTNASFTHYFSSFSYHHSK